MILITGATGFLGAELACQLLETEDKIRCIKRETSEIPELLKSFSDKIEWVNADILDFADFAEAFENVSYVYHCAAIVSFEKSMEKAMMAVNVDGTASVVNLCHLHKVKKLVHVSSIAALGLAKANEMITENNFWDAYDKNGNYAISKYRGEMEVWRGIHEGLNAVIVNPSVIIGEHATDKGTKKIFSTVKNGLNYYTSGATGLVDVKDVAYAMIKLMKSDITAERFIINSENYTFKNLTSEIAIALGVNPPQKEAKKWMLKLVWRFQAIKKLLGSTGGSLSKELIESAFTSQEYNNNKIREGLKMTFIPVSDTITKIANSIKSV